jgi:hypothetical protein
MFGFKVICWALLFIFKLRYPPGVSIATVLHNLFKLRLHHRVETYRDVTDRCKHCGRLRFHVPTFFQATGRKMINCACSASLKLVVIRSSSNQMHVSSNLPSVRTKKVGTLVTSLYVSTLWFTHCDLSCTIRILAYVIE